MLLLSDWLAASRDSPIPRIVQRLGIKDFGTLECKRYVAVIEMSSDIADETCWQVGVKMGLIEAGRSQPPQAHQIMFVQPRKQDAGLTTWLVHTDGGSGTIGMAPWSHVRYVGLEWSTGRGVVRQNARTQVPCENKANNNRRRIAPQGACCSCRMACGTTTSLCVYLWMWHRAKHADQSESYAVSTECAGLHALGKKDRSDLVAKVYLHCSLCTPSTTL